MRLEAGAGLSVEVGDDGAVRLGWGESDWLGPGTATRPIRGAGSMDAVETADELGRGVSVRIAGGDVACSVRAYPERPLVVFRIEAARDLDGLATGTFDDPARGLARLHPGPAAPGRCSPGDAGPGLPAL